MDVLYEIQKKYNSFSDKEKNIADYILKESETINNINITDLAKITLTSGSTITRFCKKICCDSFVDMKINLSSLKRNDELEQKGVLADVYSYYTEVIEKTRKLISKEQIKKVVNEIKKANKIYIYGVGSSGLTAKEMMQRLLRMGFNVYSISDPHMMIINSSIVSESDLVIGISISGETEEVINSLKISKKNGAKIVSITSFEDSHITEIGELNFIVYNALFVDKKRFINSQFSAMYLMDLISMLLLEDELLGQNMQRTIDAITKE
ncbi:MurR/RpiR family transcriptional regulator [Clostridium septicum]|uniref:MurR/RpiR family transcriptional regulator n=1 Tax=Clostridium septicum TaxID=1504 RepID=A0A9N7JM64_CLOSE|nr:MurR/RpiR family transcriptional regulator [Clostridium septicum]AYE34938.1 MurR/RpiR family transcriptional regulator [Clostridium septicum]MDU1313843.1 MurR/RpiR family transcriptional regulator [Clostridium septicum]QAS60332.1 MurR/RpiR family transcriptional regulator [Clostridium septicum]UEC20413.1 MurR/RpiR family transcriptional regulator [Clostridium septicum]USS01530.1 MurR/RpiR family transcriptional regulator [Clostridium septicum]